MTPRFINTSIRVFCLVMVVVAITRLAWLSDDSFITLRSILNISEGFGFGFNAFENVQAYTHPLWMILWMTIGMTTGSWAFSIIAVSLLCAAATVWTVLRIATDARVLILISLLALLSTSFVEYSTSGLENPLGGLLLSLLFVGSLRSTTGSPTFLGLLTAAVILTRMDYLLILGPPLAVLLLNDARSTRSAIRFSIGLAVPLALWYVWSYTTYGSILPSTYAAKTNVDIPLVEQIRQGVHYLYLSFRTDLFTLVAVLGGVLIGLTLRNWIIRGWSLGILLYLAYLTSVGGDFMVGRFLYAPFVLCLSILAFASEQVRRHMPPLLSRSSVTATIVALTAIALYIVVAPAISRPSGLRIELAFERWQFSDKIAGGIADERAYSAIRNPTLLRASRVSPVTESITSLQQLEFIADSWDDIEPGRLPLEVRVSCGRLGTEALLSGPLVHLIDECGLTDAFIASLRYAPGPGGWRVGHYYRPIPDGYTEAIRTGDHSRMVDPILEDQLREIWDRIR